MAAYDDSLFFAEHNLAGTAQNLHQGFHYSTAQINLHDTV